MRLIPEEIKKEREAVEPGLVGVGELLALYGKVLIEVACIDEYTDHGDLDDIVNCARAAIGRSIITEEE